VTESLVAQSTTTVTDYSSTVTAYSGGFTISTGALPTYSILTLGLYRSGESVPVITKSVAGATTTLLGVGLAVPTVFSATTLIASGSSILSSTSGPSSTSGSSTLNGTTSTSPTSGSTTSTNLSKHHASKPLSHGAVAGISIACAIIGAILALLVAFFLYRKKLKDARAQQTVATPPSNGKTRDLASIQSHDGLLAHAAEIIPQPLSEANIVNEMSQLGTRIKNHATNFYTSRAVNADALDLSALSGLGMDQQGISALATMLASTDARERAIRYVIARKVFACIEIPGDPKTSFLPEAAVECMRNMSASITGDGKWIPILF
jgi:hypothetical protein